MKIGYDPAKNARNIRERGLSFEDVRLLDWDSAVARQDRRTDYGEDRYKTLVEGPDGKVYVVIYTMRGRVLWVISFRRAHWKESLQHGQRA